MNRSIRKSVAGLALVAGVLTLGACSSISSMFGGTPAPEKVTLTGASEVPAVATAATAVSTIAIASDGAVSGSIVVTGMTPTMGHIHQGAVGINGPVIVPFDMNGNVFTPKPGAKLTEVQMAAFRAGNLYVNVHSAAHPAGEIRAQLKPS